MERLKESVTPSGVPFTVRNLLGEDQDALSKAINPESNAFNEMLSSALRRIGNKTENEITPNVVERMLSNDRKFVLLTLRQHTLNYKPMFEFKYEWPLQVGRKEKEVFEYEVRLTHENFPVKPYYWMAQYIEQLKSEAKEKKEEFENPDGHMVLFPVMFEAYDEMLMKYKEVEGEFPDATKTKYKFNLLDGIIEKKFAPTMQKDMRINLGLEMRNPRYLFVSTKSEDGKTKDAWASLETRKTDILYLEHLRSEINEKEGVIDTFLTIQHKTDPTRQQRVDLITLPVFFFPSQAI